VVVGEKSIGLGAGGRVEGVGLGVERAEVHGERDQGGDWGERGQGRLVYITDYRAGGYGLYLKEAFVDNVNLRGCVYMFGWPHVGRGGLK